MTLTRSLTQSPLKQTAQVRRLKYVLKCCLNALLIYFWLCDCLGGENGWADLTPVAAVSAQLFDRAGGAVEVSEPVHISVPLPSDTHVRSATSIPVWIYDIRTGEH